MKNKLRNIIALTLLPQVWLVQWLAQHPDWVETYYSTSIYPYVGLFFRSLFGWVTFPVGEIIYTSLVFLGIRYLIKQRKKIKNQPFVFLRDVGLVLAVFYFTFYFVWGLNYYRKPLSDTLDIGKSVTISEIKKLTKDLVLKTNTLQYSITKDSSEMVKVPYSKNEIIEKTILNYQVLEKHTPIFKYPKPNIKKSMFSNISSYMGIGGYLNPFTNEAIVNGKTPLFRFPVVAAHEIGHQIGYSAENETNLIGYLVTTKNSDLYFQYAASAYALSYCLNAVYTVDETAANKLYNSINEGVKKNYQELKDYHDTYKNPFEPIFKEIFSTFLKANKQADGVKSYSRVVKLMVAYHKKYPLVIATRNR